MVSARGERATWIPLASHTVQLSASTVPRVAAAIFSAVSREIHTSGSLHNAVTAAGGDYTVHLVVGLDPDDRGVGLRGLGGCGHLGQFVTGEHGLAGAVVQRCRIRRRGLLTHDRRGLLACGGQHHAGVAV